MRRSLLSALGPLLLLAACAPANTSRVTNPGTTSESVTAVPASGTLASGTSASGVPTSSPRNFSAAFAREGVAWVDAGQACVARAPSYRAVCPKLPGAAAAVAWNGGDAWAALPGAGLLVTLDRAARSVPVGRVVALSDTRAYREDGSAVTFDGLPAAGVPGTPAGVITGGDGEDYVLLAGALRRVSDGLVVETAPGPLLEATPTGARSVNLPGVVTPTGTYRLTGTALQRLDAAGRVLASVPHGAGRVGVVGADVVTVSPGGAVQVFGTDLQPVTH